MSLLLRPAELDVLRWASVAPYRNQLNLSFDPPPPSEDVPGLDEQELDEALQTLKNAALLHGDRSGGDGSIGLWHNIWVTPEGLVAAGEWRTARGDSLWHQRDRLVLEHFAAHPLRDGWLSLEVTSQDPSQPIPALSQRELAVSLRVLGSAGLLDVTSHELDSFSTIVVSLYGRQELAEPYQPPAESEVATGPPEVFISYAHEDAELARAFAAGLEAHGLRVWIDENELLPGDSIIEQISGAVAGIDFFCALVSEASRESRWCQKELSLAITKRLGGEDAVVMPLRVGGVRMPDSLVDVLYVNLDPTDVGPAVTRIADGVRRHRERRQQA